MHTTEIMFILHMWMEWCLSGLSWIDVLCLPMNQREMIQHAILEGKTFGYRYFLFSMWNTEYCNLHLIALDVHKFLVPLEYSMNLNLLRTRIKLVQVHPIIKNSTFKIISNIFYTFLDMSVSSVPKCLDVEWFYYK